MEISAIGSSVLMRTLFSDLGDREKKSGDDGTNSLAKQASENQIKSTLIPSSILARETESEDHTFQSVENSNGNQLSLKV